ncbi:hypothetical protein V2J09_002608 [Rumex salicifolius]
MERKSNIILVLVLLNACVLISSSKDKKDGVASGAKAASGTLPEAATPDGTLGVAKPGGSTIDISKLGAKPGSDVAPAWKKAWKQACKSPTHVKIVIPKGNYSLSCIEFTGPCKAPITMEIAGNFQAPSSMSQFTGPDPTWVRFERVMHLTVTAVSGGGIFDGNGEEGWTTKGCFKDGLCKTKPYNFRYFYVNNSIIQGITSLDSKQFHNMIIRCENLTMKSVKIIAPGDARNTDGFHVARSKDVKILDCPIQTGDDCISIGDGTKNLTVERVSCGPGHGISVGSLGKFDHEDEVRGIYITNCSFKNTDNGLRIKSWLNSKPCTASQMHFKDIIMDNVSNPIFIDQAYCPSTKCDTSVPSQVKISDVSFKNIRGTGSNPSVLRLVCSRGHPCNNVHLENIDLKYTGPLGPAASECCNVKPMVVGKVSPQACAVKTTEKDSSMKITVATTAAAKGAGSGSTSSDSDDK